MNDKLLTQKRNANVNTNARPPTASRLDQEQTKTDKPKQCLNGAAERGNNLTSLHQDQ